MFWIKQKIVKNIGILKTKNKHIDTSYFNYVKASELPVQIKWALKKHQQSIVLSPKLALILVHIWVAAENALSNSMLDGATVLR